MYDMEDARFTLKVRLLEAEVTEAPVYGGVTWTLSPEHSTELRTVHRKLPPRIIGV